MSDENNPPAAPSTTRTERRRWLIRLFVRPILFLATGALLILGLGLAQRLGWISDSSGGKVDAEHAAAEAEDVWYICPMMCTPPRREPGRCPVCGMELVPAGSNTGQAHGEAIDVDPVARRVAGIRTTAVKSVPLIRKIRAVGELSYDEGRLKTIAAYFDGRIEKLYADYTGMVVDKGNRLALVYSPQLYSGQVELLVAKRTQQRRSSTSTVHSYAGVDLYASAKDRLIEFGMTESQIDALEQRGKAESRLELIAPISGTVIEKLAVEGQYVKTGQPIYRLADLSTVWLMLELFPEDAALIRDGQEVAAEVQSLPGRMFNGHVSFIDPTVDSSTRTIGVRVTIPNEHGLLRVGDYAKATIAVHVGASGEEVAEPSPVLVVPRSAVLMVGETSVVYVETEPGRFETRRVVLGPSADNEIAILDGLKEGEQVAYSGNFLIDSQMQLVGNPSLIDPTKAKTGPDDSHEGVPQMELPPIGTPELSESAVQLPPIGTPQMVPKEAEDDEMTAALAELSPADRALVERQSICPVTEMPLGSMGTPIKVDVNGRPVFICCEGCRESLLADPAKYLARLPKEAAQ